MASTLPGIKHIWVITGPAGCGKTTVGTHIGNTLNLPFIEGDKFHRQDKIDMMKSGIPLEDADRWDWLIRLRDAAVTELLSGNSGVVLACSALKKRYRDVLRIASYFNNQIATHFVCLDVNEDVLLERVKNREGHYMKDSMVQSQIESLEKPTADEIDCVVVDVSGPSVKVLEQAIHTVKTAIASTVMETHAATAS